MIMLTLGMSPALVAASAKSVAPKSLDSEISSGRGTDLICLGTALSSGTVVPDSAISKMSPPLFRPDMLIVSGFNSLKYSAVDEVLFREMR